MFANRTLAAPQNWAEHIEGGPSYTNIPGTYAQDCATTTDNRRAAVRYANPAANSTVVAIWDLTGAWTPGSEIPIATFGPGFLSGFQTSLTLSNPFGGYMPSDRIDLSNELGVSIGAGDSGFGANDETYIEVFDIGSTPPSMVTQFVWSPTPGSYDITRAGYAHDVAITRDATHAVVNSQNWIFVVTVPSPPTSAALQAFNIGGLDYAIPSSPVPWVAPCTPNRAMDSVAVTNTRAVVTTARWSSTFNTFTTWVYIIDLAASGGPAIVMQDEIVPPIGSSFQEGDEEWPHDVVITPSRDGGGTMAVVTTNHAVALYDLVTNQPLGADYFDKDDRRLYQKPVDSVEATGKTAVVISDHLDPFGVTHWNVKVFDLTATGLNLTAEFNSAGEAEDHSHDLAIDWDFNLGLVRTSTVNVILPSLSPAPTSIVPLASGSDVHAYELFAASIGASVFSSDSVVIGIEQNGSLMAATIGGAWDALNSQWYGVVDIIDLLAAAPSVTPVSVVSNNPGLSGCVPLDLAISFNQNDLVVRSADPLPEAPSATGPDLVRISLATGTFVRQYGGSGIVMGLDSLAAPSLTGFVNTVRKVLSVSQDPSSGGLDYEHVAK